MDICDHFWAWNLIGPLSVSYAKAMSLTSTQTALLVATPILVGSVGRIPVGALTDRFGGRRMFTAISLISIVPVLLVALGGQINSYPLLLLFGFFLGIAGTAFAVGIPFVRNRCTRCTGSLPSRSTKRVTSSPLPTPRKGDRLEETVTECSLDFDGGPGMYATGSGPFGEASGQPVPVAVETFQALKQRQTSEEVGVGSARPSRVNLLNWDGKGSPDSMFTPRPGSPRLSDLGDAR